MNYEELKKDARYYALGDEDSTDYPDDTLKRNINKWYDRVDHWAWNASSTWGFDDANATTLPEATTDLVAGQRDYEIPTTIRSVDMALVKNSDGDWNRLKPMDESQISGSLEELFEDDSLPRYYDMKGNSVMLYPSPDAGEVTTTSGLKLYLSRHVTKFTGASGTVPGFDRSFHSILSHGAALDYALANELASKEVDLRRVIYGGQTGGLKEEFERFISTRNKEFKQRMVPKMQNYE